MRILLNGQDAELSDALEQTLQGLVEGREMKADRVAVEHNGEIVPRSRWQETALQPGDCVEIVHFVGGGLHEAFGRELSSRWNRKGLLSKGMGHR